MPVGAKLVVVFKAGIEHRVSLSLGHAFVFVFVVVSQTDVFHGSFPPKGSQQHSLTLDRSFYSRRAQKKSTTGVAHFLKHRPSRTQLATGVDSPHRATI